MLFIHCESENLGIEALSASIKQSGHQVDLLFLPQQHQTMAFHVFSQKYDDAHQLISQKIKKYQPDIIGFSPFSSQFVWAGKEAAFIKRKFPSILIVFGGVHVNSVPQLVIKNPNIDAIIIGEADKQIVALLDNLSHSEKLKTIPSLWIKIKGKLYRNRLAPLEQDLERLPFPDKEIFYKYIPKPIREEGYMIMGSRGCPFHCTYCSNNLYQKLYSGQQRLRFRSPENIIDELVAAKKKYKPRMVEFFDDVLTIEEERLSRLMKMYRKKINIPFTCYLHPQLVSEKMIRLLAKSNCYWLKLGIQSANEDYRRKNLARFESNQQVLKVASWCHKYNLSFSLDHIFNLPGETEDDLVEAIELYLKCRPTIINFGSLIYLPGTEIIKLGLKEGILNKKAVKNINERKDPVFKLANVDLISHQYQKNRAGNISVFALMMMMITTMPSALVSWLLKRKIYRTQKRIPQPILVLFKVLAKIKAKQLYIYRFVFKSLFYYTFSHSG